LATAALSFGPALWLSFEGGNPAAVALAASAGALYAPMAWLAASVSQRFLAITPLTVLPLLTRANRSYWLGCGLLSLALALGSVVGEVLRETLPMLVSTLLGTAAAFYFLMIEMRILGLIWCHHHEDFGLD
jgi:hypothetical protein